MEGRLKQTIRHPKMEVLVDFNGLGLGRINEWENITDYVLEISGSKEKASESIGGVTSDIVTIVTDNTQKTFSKDNVNSPFYQKVKSNVNFVLKSGFKDEDLKIYATGIITKFAPAWNDKKYNVSAEDYFYLLKNTDAPKTAYQDVTLDELVGLLLDEAGIPSQINRIIPKTEFSFQYFKFEEPNCFDALKKLMEISVGQAYFEGLNFVFETKLALDYELDLTVKHTIEEDDIFTFDETVEDTDIVNTVSIVSNPKMIDVKQIVFQTPENIVQIAEEPIIFGSGTYFYIDSTHLPIINNAENPISVKNLTQGRTININSVDINTGKVTIHPESLAYVATGDLLIVSYSYQQLVLLAGQSRTFSLNLSGEVHALTDVDVAVWDATGQLPRVYSTTPNAPNSVSLNQFTFDQASGLVTVTLKNNYTEGITISTLQLRGNPIKSANPMEIYVRDLPSVNQYKKQEIQIANNYFTNTKLAQKIAQFIVDNRSQPRKKIGVDMDGYTELELNDIAKVIESSSGTNHTFYADRIDYSFTSDGGWSAKVTFTQTETEQWVYESFKGESWEKTNPGTPIDDFIFEINANMIKNGGAELHTGIADYPDAGAISSVHYVPDYWRFTRSTGNASARVRTGGELALHADQSFEITTSNSGSGYYEQTLTGIVPSKTHSASFVARLDGCTGSFIVEQYANTTLIKTLEYDVPEGYKEYEFQFASEPTATSFIIKFKKKAGTKGSESMIFDKVKVEEAEKASIYVEANETQTVQAGQKYDNSVIIGNNYGVSVYDANNTQRVRMGQYAPGKYGLRLDNGALEIVNGLLYEQLAVDVGSKLDISDNNAITSLATSMSGLDGELGTLSGTVESHASLIQQNSTAISQRVLTSTYTTDKNGILQRLSDAETAINQTAEDITLLATYDQLSELGDTVAQNTAAINVNAKAITSKVEQTTFDNLKIGARNYALGTGTEKKVTGTGATNQNFNLYAVDYSKISGKEITISFDIVSTVNSGTARLQWNGDPWSTLGTSKTVSTTKTHYSFTVTQPAKSTGLPTQIQLRLDNVTGDVTVSNLKLEIGNKETSHTIAPEDTDSVLSSMSTTINQTAEEVSLNVVKKGSVITSVNASAEGIKIKASLLDITGLVKFSTLDSDMQTKINNAGTAYDDTVRWKLPNTTLINGGLIAADTVTASQILVGSWENLFQNGDFEKQTAGWKDASAWSVVNTSPYSGNYHAEGSWGSASSISYYDDREISVRAGEKYYFEGYFRTKTSTTTKARTILVRFKDKTGAYSYFIVEETLTTSYQKFSYVVDIPSDCVSMTIGLSVKSGMPSGNSTYADNLFCKRMTDGSLIVDGSITASMIKSLNGLSVGTQFQVDANGNVTIGAGATLNAAKFVGLRGNTISFGDYGAKIDTSIAGAIKRTRFATNDETYLAIDDDGRFNFVMKTLFDVYAAPSASGGHYVFKLGSAMIKGLGTGGVMQVRNYDDSLYGDLAAKDLTATGKLDVWGRGTISGTDLTINGTTGGMLKLKGSPYAYMEFYNGNTQVGFVGTENASGSNSIMLQNNNAGEVVIKTGAVRVKFDKSVEQVVFKDDLDDHTISIIAKDLTNSSLREWKKDITPFSTTAAGRTALEELCETTVYNYRFNEETECDPLRIGLIYDEAPYELVDIRGQGINQYAMTALNFQATKELNAKLESKVQMLLDRISILEGQTAN